LALRISNAAAKAGSSAGIRSLTPIETTDDMRLRLARELHDEVANPLIALVLGLHELRGERDAGSGAEAELAAVEESVREVVRVIVLSAFADKSPISEAMASRPQGYVHEDVTPEDNVALILALHSNGQSPVRVGALDLSRRELHVLKQVATGLSNKQIARKLGISHKTVRNHLSQVFRKLHAGNRTEAVMNAVRDGLFSA